MENQSNRPSNNTESRKQKESSDPPPQTPCLSSDAWRRWIRLAKLCAIDLLGNGWILRGLFTRITCDDYNGTLRLLMMVTAPAPEKLPLTTIADDHGSTVRWRHLAQLQPTQLRLHSLQSAAQAVSIAACVDEENDMQYAINASLAIRHHHHHQRPHCRYEEVETLTARRMR